MILATFTTFMNTRPYIFLSFFICADNHCQNHYQYLILIIGLIPEIKQGHSMITYFILIAFCSHFVPISSQDFEKNGKQLVRRTGIIFFSSAAVSKRFYDSIFGVPLHLITIAVAPCTILVHPIVAVSHQLVSRM